MRCIRVLVGQMPQLLRDVVVGLVGDAPDLKLVAGRSAGPDVEALLRTAQPDVLVFVENAAGAARREDLLREHTRLKLLVLSAGGRDAELHWLEPRSTRCVDVTPDRLVGLIRSAFDEEGAA